MPLTKSAKKALRQNIRRRAQNLVRQKELKAAIKKFKKGLGPADLSAAYKKLDKAAKVNLIHLNKAGRIKSQLAQLIRKSVSASS